MADNYLSTSQQALSSPHVKPKQGVIYMKMLFEAEFPAICPISITEYSYI